MIGREISQRHDRVGRVVGGGSRKLSAADRVETGPLVNLAMDIRDRLCRIETHAVRARVVNGHVVVGGGQILPPLRHAELSREFALDLHEYSTDRRS